MVMEDIGGIIADSVHEVFETLIFVLPEDESPREVSEGRFEGELVSSIQISGDYNGVITMVSSRHTAQFLTRNMLGIEGSDVGDEEISDCTGEIVNMVAGNIKTRCLEGGKSFILAIPTVVSGENVVVSLQEELQGIEVPFNVEGEVVVFSLLAKEQNGLPE